MTKQKSGMSHHGVCEFTWAWAERPHPFAVKLRKNGAPGWDAGCALGETRMPSGMTPKGDAGSFGKDTQEVNLA